MEKLGLTTIKGQQVKGLVNILESQRFTHKSLHGDSDHLSKKNYAEEEEGSFVHGENCYSVEWAIKISLRS